MLSPLLGYHTYEKESLKSGDLLFVEDPRLLYSDRQLLGKAVLWIRNVFFSDPIPDPDPTFQRVSDPTDPDPV
jgi:hypothetical protein